MSAGLFILVALAVFLATAWLYSGYLDYRRTMDRIEEEGRR
jgi:hypothetical protein